VGKSLAAENIEFKSFATATTVARAEQRLRNVVSTSACRAVPGWIF